MTDFEEWRPTIAAVGTSVMWSTGNEYENKFPNLVHKDLTGDYPIDETYLHYTVGSGPPGDASDPTPAYFEKTTGETDGNGDPKYDPDDYHPNGDPIPPRQYRARGGAIMGLSPPAPVKFGNQNLSKRTHTDDGNYLAENADGSYYGKLDWTDEYSSVFNPDSLNEAKWLVARDVGWSWPTIPAQMEQFRRGNTVDVPEGTNLQRFGGEPDDEPPAGEDVDLVLVDGGTNDLTLGWLNDPTKSGRKKIWQAVRQYMYRDMVGKDGTRGLLERARDEFPNAVIALMGEPVWASNRTDRQRARKFLKQRLGRGNPGRLYVNFGGAAEQAFDNVLNFSRFQAYYLRRSVAEMNRRDSGPGFILTPPGYGVVNGMMADWPWSFGFDPDGLPGGNLGITTDPVSDVRRGVCEREYSAEHDECLSSSVCLDSATDRDQEVDPFACRNAPIGHPNPEGCRQFADTIVRRYKTHIHRSLGDLSDELDGGTDSLRRSLGRYDFDLAGDGVSYAASHDVVDAMRVKVDTKSGAGMGRQRGEAYLTVYPGRNGNGERFRLDTENNDNRPGGPKSRPLDAHKRPKDEYYIDPMMSRRLSGEPGNFDDDEGGGGRDERDVQTYESGDHWSDRRLRLSDVRHATLELRGVDPGKGWGINDVELSINGHVTRTRTFPEIDNEDLRSDHETERPFRHQEFLLASFNHVDGVGESDLAVSVPEDGVRDAGSSRDRVAMEADVRIRNTGSTRIPSVGLQCGLRLRTRPNAEFEGLDWRFRPTSDVAPGETITPTVRLATDEVAHFRGNLIKDNAIEVVAHAHVSGEIGRTSTVIELGGS